MTTNSSFDETVVDDPGARVLYWVLFPVLGAGLGWVVRWAAGWIAGLPVAPLHAVFKAIDEAPDPQATLVALGVGLLVGVVVSVLAVADMLVVRVGIGEVTLTRGGSTKRRVARGDVTAVFFDRDQLVLLGRDARELAREKTDLSKTRVEAAFTGKGYPWRADGDPHRDEFRIWTRLDDDLPGVAHGLLIDRAAALAEGKTAEAAELREHLLKLGIVVRDEKKKQQWRRDRRELA